MLEHTFWDCRWPDPVAIQVATKRILAARPPDDPALNRRLSVVIHMDPPQESDNHAQAILVTPWAVERIHWHTNSQRPPAIKHATPLETDGEGRVAAGQGVILKTGETTVPVLIAWEPETGHHFVETLLHSVHEFITSEQAMAAALGQLSRQHKRSFSERMDRPIRRRDLFNLFGR